MNDTLFEPLHTADDLGKPIPDSPHAVSACLPLWEHNIGYEKADPRIIERMQCGYPRFFVHPLVARLFEECERRFARSNERCFAFPSQNVALRCAQFISRQTKASVEVHDFDQGGLWAVSFSQSAYKAAMSYWQHSGEIVSSRQAVAVIEDRTTGASTPEAKQILRERIAGFSNVDADNVLLFPNGMAAIYCAYRAAKQMRPNLKSIQFGFPYVDALKIQQRFGTDVHLFPNGNDSELKEVRDRLQNEKMMALFCEIPGNPLLASPDLKRLAELGEAHGFPLIVDDTLGALINIDALPAADLLTTSLTKFFSGRGDVMGGSLVFNPNKPLYNKLKAAVLGEYEDLLFSEDAVVLEQNSRDALERVRRINQTAEQLCDALRKHSAVERIDYPKYRTTENYRQYLKLDGGYGGLFSIQLHDPARCAPQFFDALRISKGPNLGTNFTLCCPYTILAHYHELDFAESCHISRYLLRVSVGLEEPEWLIARFTEALDRLQTIGERPV